jgi:hypothetical protein
MKIVVALRKTRRLTAGAHPLLTRNQESSAVHGVFEKEQSTDTCELRIVESLYWSRVSCLLLFSFFSFFSFFVL